MMRSLRIRGRWPGRLAGFFVAASLALTAAPASAGHVLSVGSCFSREAALGRIHYDHADLVLRGYHHDAVALWLVRRINASPPATAYLADEVLVYAGAGEPRLLALLFHGECVVMGIDLAPGLYRHWMKFLHAAAVDRGRNA